MKVPDLSRKTEDPLFLIRPIDLDMSWNPDSADAFSLVVFLDTDVQATERYVAEMGNLTGIFERPVLATDTVEPVAESLAGSAADSESVSSDTLGSDDYDEVQVLTLMCMLIFSCSFLTALNLCFPPRFFKMSLAMIISPISIL